MNTERSADSKPQSDDPRESTKGSPRAGLPAEMPKPVAELTELLAEALARRWIAQGAVSPGSELPRRVKGRVDEPSTGQSE